MRQICSYLRSEINAMEHCFACHVLRGYVVTTLKELEFEFLKPPHGGPEHCYNTTILYPSKRSMEKILPSCPQEAWSEKVFMLCSEDFKLLFSFFRTLNHKMTTIIKSSIEPLLRYGNPDSQNLATLKNKIHIHRFLSFLSNNLGSDFMFRVAICL